MATSYSVSGKCPIFNDGRTKLNVTSEFGYRNDPITGKANSKHNGVDIVGAANVCAVANGIVTAVYKNCVGKDTRNHTAGNYVFLDHGNGVISKYMHLKYATVKVNKGQTVKQGTVLGYMGTTGYSTGVHLHFQIDVNGTPINPLPYARGLEKITPSGVSASAISEAQAAFDPEVGAGYQPSTDDILSVTNNNISDSDFVKIKHIAGVFGLPYQFLPTADLRLDGSKTTENIGYEYGEKIIERITLLFMAPGKANFMTKYSKKNKQNVLEKLITLGADNDNKTSLNDLLDSDGRYYTFEYDTVR